MMIKHEQVGFVPFAPDIGPVEPFAGAPAAVPVHARGSQVALVHCPLQEGASGVVIPRVLEFKGPFAAVDEIGVTPENGGVDAVTMRPEMEHAGLDGNGGAEQARTEIMPRFQELGQPAWPVEEDPGAD